MSDLFARLRPYVIANKRKGEHRTNIFKAINKYWKRVYYKRFYQMDKVIGSDKFFCCTGTIVRQYRGPHRIITIRAINNFTFHRILNSRVEVSSNSYRHQTTNNFEKLLEEEGVESISTIMISILISICMHIGPTGFLEDSASEVVFGIDGKIQGRLVIVC